MDSNLIVVIVNAIITILTVFGVSLVGFKKVLKALGESADLIHVARNAFADDKLTEEEIEEFIKELNEAKGAWKDVYAGKKQQ